MIISSDFQERLASKILLSPVTRKHLNKQEQQLLQWTAGLPVQSEITQAQQLEKVLTELIDTDLEDSLRLQQMSIVVTAADRLITSLHRHYIYELGTLNAQQLEYSSQVQSLYYLMILVYDQIVQRENIIVKSQQRRSTLKHFRQLFSSKKSSSLVLAGAIYAALASYLKLLSEKALLYQKLPENTWLMLNQLYYLAYQHDVIHFDLSEQVIIRQAKSIHQIYTQLCLHNLLNVQAMVRPIVIVLQRSLSVWANHVNVTVGPQSDTRVFVAIDSPYPPSYYTADSIITPHDDQHTCLFIDLKPLATYLEQRKQDLQENDNESIEYRLSNKVLMAIKYRYIERQDTIPTKYSPKQRATIITKFNSIHYYVAQHSLMDIIDATTLPAEQLPHYDTQPLTAAAYIEVETFDSTDAVSHFRLLQLLSVPDESEVIAKEDKLFVPESTLSRKLVGSLVPVADAPPQEADSASTEVTSYRLMTAPPQLPIASLILLCRPNINGKLKWSMGVVRWLNLETNKGEVEWQLLGHTINACALRKDSIDSRSIRFVPAFIIANDDSLQTNASLLVPSYHFRSQDRVVVRMDNEQKLLRLQRCLLSTEECSQYDFIIL